MAEGRFTATPQRAVEAGISPTSNSAIDRYIAGRATRDAGLDREQRDQFLEARSDTRKSLSFDLMSEKAFSEGPAKAVPPFPFPTRRAVQRPEPIRSAFHTPEPPASRGHVRGCPTIVTARPLPPTFKHQDPPYFVAHLASQTLRATIVTQ